MVSRQRGILAGTLRRMATFRTWDRFRGSRVTRLPNAASVDLSLDYRTSVLSVIIGMVIVTSIWLRECKCLYLQVACTRMQAI